MQAARPARLCPIDAVWKRIGRSFNLSEQTWEPEGMETIASEIAVAPVEQRELQRAIGSRQLSMIAIGGAIGTGLFLASGGAISQAGPGGAMLAYAIMGIAVYCMMQSLGEMATQLPIRGSFETYAERFIDPSFGFAVGWNYWFSWATTLAAELVRRRAHRQVLVPAQQLHRLVHGVLRPAVGLEPAVGQGLCRSGVLVFQHQGRHRPDLRCRRHPHDHRHGGRRGRGVSELDAHRSQDRRARPLPRRLDDGVVGVPHRGVLLSRHGRRGPGRGGNRGSRKECAQGDSHRVLAHPAVLHRRHIRHRQSDRIHRSEPAEFR